MGVREHRLGEGTIGYRGEPAEYWRAKTDALPRRRSRVTLLLVGIALVLGLFAVSPIGPQAARAQVQARSAAVGDEPERLLLLLDGERLIEAPVAVRDAAPPAGSSFDVTVMADGRVVLGREPLVGVWALVLLFGTAATWRAVYAYRLRDRRIVYR